MILLEIYMNKITKIFITKHAHCIIAQKFDPGVSKNSEKIFDFPPKGVYTGARKEIQNHELRLATNNNDGMIRDYPYLSSDEHY